MKFCCDSWAECEIKWIFWIFVKVFETFEVDRIRWGYQVWNLPSFLQAPIENERLLDFLSVKNLICGGVDRIVRVETSETF